MLGHLFPGTDWVRWRDIDVAVVDHHLAYLDLAPAMPGRVLAGLIEPRDAVEK